MAPSAWIASGLPSGSLSMSALRAVVVSVAHPRCGYSSISSGIRKPCRSSKPSISWRSVTPACPPRWWRPAGFSRVWQHADHHAHQRGAHRQRGFRLCVDLSRSASRPWGVAGAGYATALGTWASAFMGCTWCFRKTRERAPGCVRAGGGRRFDEAHVEVWRAERLAVGARGLAFSIFLVFIGRMSNAMALRCQRDRATVMMLAVLPALGVAQAVSVLVGQHRGKRPEKSKSRRGADCRWL